MDDVVAAATDDQVDPGGAGDVVGHRRATVHGPERGTVSRRTIGWTEATLTGMSFDTVTWERSTALGASARGTGVVEEPGFARNAGGGGRGLVGGRIDRQRPTPAGVAGDGRAGAQEAETVEIGIALDIDQHLGVAAGDVDVIENDVADRLGDVVARGLAPVDLDAGVGVGIGRHRIGAAGDGDVLDQRVAGEAEQDDVAVAVAAAVAVLLERRVDDVDRVEPERAAAGSDAVDAVGGEIRILD